MCSTTPAPAGDGDTKSWFEFYKWTADGETYLPVKHPFISAEAGDFLWMVMDGRVLGGVPILRVETPTLPVQTQEVWFDASQILESPEFQPMIKGREIDPDVGELLLRTSTPRRLKKD